MNIFVLIIIALFFSILGILLIVSVNFFKKLRDEAINSRSRDSKEKNEYKGILRLLWVNKLLGGISIVIGWFVLLIMVVVQ